MQDLLHAIGFIITFGMVFVGIIILEAWYWHKKGELISTTSRKLWRVLLRELCTNCVTAF